ncbi:MAG: hypothetical protein KGV51_05440 [Moraxellaceae bacterium]|nr:hypothetical protein [Moraxellaceae bacterium]
MPTVETDYKDWDFSNAKPVSEVPALKRLQEARAKAHKQALDDDVLDWISKQDNNTRNRINEMIRQVMAIYQPLT